jgi:predicted GIY-YIG superfamily endonuclease
MTVPGSTASLSSAISHVLAKIPQPGETALYRFFGPDGELLYVGITKNPSVRFADHSRTYAMSWWPRAVALTVEWHPTRTAAGRAERAAIRAEEPLHNIQHTARNRVPIAQRISNEAVTLKRGDALLAVLKRHFHDRPFTAADVVNVAKSSRSAAEKNLGALANRGEILVVGARHVVPTKGSRRTSTLYALALHEWLDETGSPLEESRIPRTTPMPRKRKPRRITLKEKFAPLPRPRAVADESLPPEVTFASGAALLVRLKYVDRITPDGIRYIAKTAEDWPFGADREHAYGKAGNAQTMNTKVFLNFFRSGVRRGGQGRHSAAALRRAAEGRHQ